MSDLQILAVEAREIVVTMTASITTVRSILRCADACVIELDMNDPDNKKAYEEFKAFCEFLEEFNKGMKDGRP